MDDFEDFILGMAEDQTPQDAQSIRSRSQREFDLGWSPRNSGRSGSSSGRSRRRGGVSDFEIDQAIDDLLSGNDGNESTRRAGPLWDDTRLLSSRSLNNRSKPQRKPLDTRSLRSGTGGVSWGPTVYEPVRPESMPGVGPALSPRSRKSSLRPQSPRRRPSQPPRKGVSSLLSFVDKLDAPAPPKKSPRRRQRSSKSPRRQTTGTILTELPRTKTECKAILKDELVQLARQYKFNVYKPDGKTLKTKEQLCADLVKANKGIQEGNPTKEVKPKLDGLPRTKTECREILKDDLVELAERYGVPTDRPDPKKSGKRIPRTKPDICNDLLSLSDSATPVSRRQSPGSRRHKFVPRQPRPPSPRSYSPRHRRARRPSSARTSGF